jgi:hypothetical protein
MGLFQRLAGVVNTFFQINGPGGNGFTSVAGQPFISAANPALSFVNVRGADPLVADDLTTKRYVDAIFKPLIVTAQANAPSALIANSGVAHYIVVSTPGTGAAAAYVAGTVLFDNGTGVGNVAILGPTVGGSIITTVALAGGTFTFNANNEYVWTAGSIWQDISPSLAGVVSCIDFAIGTGAAQSSVTSIPANAVVLRADVSITTPYSAGATIEVGQTGTPILLQDIIDNFPLTVGDYSALQRTGWGAAPLPVLVTVGGAPAAGVGRVTVEYSLPQA